MEVELVSPDRILFSGEATMVICRTTEGEIAFLNNHAPFVGALDVAVVRIHQADGSVERAAVHEGFVEVRDNRVTILSDVAELPSHIDEERARQAKEQAETRLRGVDDAECEAALRRAHVRLELAQYTRNGE